MSVGVWDHVVTGICLLTFAPIYQTLGTYTPTFAGTYPVAAISSENFSYPTDSFTEPLDHEFENNSCEIYRPIL